MYKLINVIILDHYGVESWMRLRHNCSSIGNIKDLFCILDINLLNT